MANTDNLDLKRLDGPKTTKFDYDLYVENNFEKVDAAVGAKPTDLTTTAKTIIPAINELKSDKVDKETGKGLSTNDYTTTEKNKLAGIPADTAEQLNDMTQDFSAQLAEIDERNLTYVVLKADSSAFFIFFFTVRNMILVFG